jgi:hypothetical protein
MSSRLPATSAAVLLALGCCADSRRDALISSPHDRSPVPRVGEPSPTASPARLDLSGVSFSCPRGFQVGTPEPLPEPDRLNLASAIVVVERTVAEEQGIDLASIPWGVPSITLWRLHPEQAELLIGSARDVIDFHRKSGLPSGDYIEEIMLGEHAVQRLPFWPGPFGEYASVYLLPHPGGGSVVVVAHRFTDLAPGGRPLAWSDKPTTRPTGYDVLAQELIKSLQFRN